MKSGKLIANFVINDLLGLLKKNNLTIEQSPLKPEAIGWLARLVESGCLEKRKMRELLKKWFQENLDERSKSLDTNNNN